MAARVVVLIVISEMCSWNQVALLYADIRLHVAATCSANCNWTKSKVVKQDRDLTLEIL